MPTIGMQEVTILYQHGAGFSSGEGRGPRKTTEYRTDKKEKKTFLIYKEIQMGSVAKSYIRKGFLKYEEMRKYLTIYEEAVSFCFMRNG
jgi:hypothetical protein